MSIIDAIMSALRSLTGGGTEKSTGASGSTGPESKGQVSTEYDPDAEPATPDTSTEAAVKGGDVDRTTDESDIGADDGDAESDEPDTDEASGVVATEADDAEAAADGSADPVETIMGIGPAYGGRLAEYGIETVGELATADTADVAEGIDVSESRVGDWIERANDAS